MLEPLQLAIAISTALAVYIFFVPTAVHYWFATVLFVVLSLMTILYVVADSITGEGINEAVFFHLTTDLTGADPLLIAKVVLLAIGLLGCLALPLYYGWQRLRCRPRRPFSIAFVSHFVLMTTASFYVLQAHPALANRSSLWPEEEIWIPEMVAFDAPENQRPMIAPQEKKNLLFIYVESVERTFMNEEMFPGLTENLRRLEATSLSIHGIGQAPMTNWTIAGMVASQCGVPFKVLPRKAGDDSASSAFLPGRTCLGDVLAAEGYKNIYIGGADLAFAGKGDFYRNHGFDSVYGVDDIQRENGGTLPVSTWGVYDDDLLPYVRKNLTMAAKGKQPFALFMLTLDTHPPEGHPTAACKDVRYEANPLPMLNAIKCADTLVTRFVREIENSDLAKNLVIVIASDHLQMRGDATDILNARKNSRENLFLARGRSISPEVIERTATTLDIAPTVLELLGFDIHSFALGRSLVDRSEKTLGEKYGRGDFYSQVTSWRMNYLRSLADEKSGAPPLDQPETDPDGA